MNDVKTQLKGCRGYLQKARTIRCFLGDDLTALSILRIDFYHPILQYAKNISETTGGKAVERGSVNASRAAGEC